MLEGHSIVPHSFVLLVSLQDWLPKILDLQLTNPTRIARCNFHIWIFWIASLGSFCCISVPLKLKHHLQGRLPPTSPRCTTHVQLSHPDLGNVYCTMPEPFWFSLVTFQGLFWILCCQGELRRKWKFKGHLVLCFIEVNMRRSSVSKPDKNCLRKSLNPESVIFDI